MHQSINNFVFQAWAAQRGDIGFANSDYDLNLDGQATFEKPGSNSRTSKVPWSWHAINLVVKYSIVKFCSFPAEKQDEKLQMSQFKFKSPECQLFTDK
jgi:hypothetical protein